MNEAELERRLKILAASPADRGETSADDAAAARIMAALTHLPPQRRRFGAWVATLLDLDFTPAWPRVAALAGVAALGFLVCTVGLDLRPARGSAILLAQGNTEDLGAFAFEPEPLTGLRP